MRGAQHIVIQSRRIRYDFTIQRNITIIAGDSATGKTTLVDMVRDYYENGADSGITLTCDKECTVLYGRNWQAQLALYSDSIVFIDEGSAFVTSEDFARAIQGTDNYYVIITRESLENLPYSVREIYGLRESGKYGGLKQRYNELYRLHGLLQSNTLARAGKAVIEDSNAGFEFFSAVFSERQIPCVSAQGKSNIFGMLTNMPDDETVLVIADGAAFGSQVGKLSMLIKQGRQIILYLPESFEWLILQADFLKDNAIRDILRQPSEAIESARYISWERFFTELLAEKTAGSIWEYHKRRLNPIYLHEQNKKAILAAGAGG